MAAVAGSFAENFSCDFSVPVRNIRLLVRSVRRNPQHQCLVARVSGLQGLVEHRPVIDTLLGLNKSPVDSEVGDGGHGKVFGLERSMKGLVLDREALGPLGAGVQRIAVEALKRGEPNIRIHESSIEWFRLDGNRLGRRLREGSFGVSQREVPRTEQKDSQSQAAHTINAPAPDKIPSLAAGDGFNSKT